MSGIYIHVPFCVKKCDYCDFFSLAGTRGLAPYRAAVRREVELRFNYLPNKMVKTIYFGGGTPSQLSPMDIEAILASIFDKFEVDAHAEISLEANPDDLSQDFLRALRHIGINRLSIGIQSFSDNDLRFLGRRHDAKGALSSIGLAPKVGFDNISIDLMYALPSASKSTWKENLNIAFKQGVQHLSCYSLTFERGTPLFQKWKEGNVSPLSDETGAEQFQLLQEMASRNGFIHYEISNLCLPSFESKHNSSYWKGRPYLGLGPSAHSYNGETRDWSPRSLERWLHGIETGVPEMETEVLTPKNRLNEMLMLSLRTCEGIYFSQIVRLFGAQKLEEVLTRAEKFIRSGAMQLRPDRLIIEPAHWFTSDSLIVDLME